MKSSSRSGQVVVEYILIAAIIVGIIVGVFWRILEQKMGEIQQVMEEKLTAIIAQDEVVRGLPLGWFGFDTPDTSNVRFLSDGAEESPPDAENGGGDTPDDSGSPDGGAGSPPVVKNLPKTSGPRGGNPPSPPSSGRPPDPERRDSSDSNSAEDDKANAPKPRNKDPQADQPARRPNPESDQSLGGEFSGDEELDEPPGKEEKDKKKKLQGGGAGDQQRFLFGREVKEERSGCEDADFFMLIKIFAFVGILLLVASVLVTARGQKGK